MSASNTIALNERMPPKKPSIGQGLRHGVTGSHAVTPVVDSHHHGTIGPIARYRVDELLKGGREATLLHRGQEYRLRITATGKLILTK
ncbi:hemin uptake protein HemP [Hyphomicrobium sp.]|jgi:hemin uptake protein HemP|uniref:hemin uptake protein HemP n=1 Tax=Hyphomicrobium sp. TaxID=82 RepID=UPI003566B893